MNPADINWFNVSIFGFAFGLFLLAFGLVALIHQRDKED